MFIGHQKQLKILENSIRINEIVQSYIFSGPENIGKFSLAKMFAKALVENNPNILGNIDLADENKNQDIEILAPEIIEKKGVIKKRDIDIEKVRTAQKNLALFPAIGGYRVLIIDDANRLTVAAQNALLKILEEPNNTAVIILVTYAEGNILKTVKSRCRKINFNLVPLEEIRRGFQDEVSGEFLEKIAIFSMGKPGEAKKLLKDKKNLENKEKIISDLNRLRSLSITEKLNLAEEYAKNLIQARERLEFWIWILRLQIFKNLNKEDNIQKNYLIINKIEEALLKMKNLSFNNRIILENLFLNL